MRIVGNATENAKIHALTHISIILLTKPTLKMLITRDMMQDINNEMKNEKTSLWCFLFIIYAIYPKMLMPNG
jgi:hypothetical protein